MENTLVFIHSHYKTVLQYYYTTCVQKNVAEYGVLRVRRSTAEYDLYCLCTSLLCEQGFDKEKL